MSEISPLGQATVYPDQYSPDLLYAIARIDARSALGIEAAPPFHGTDIWNAWDLTWLGRDGLPRVGTAEIRIPADSPNLVESKSLKLYLGSFAMTGFDSRQDLAAIMTKDLSAATGGDVNVVIRDPEAADGSAVARLPGRCIDTLHARCDVYEVDPGLLDADADDIVAEDLHSHLLRSLCPVTGQPDVASISFSYRGPRIDPAALLRYVVAYRQHRDFHEVCVERMFMDIRERCGAEQLSVYARYQRRGGIDINPFRSNFESSVPNTRLWRQ
ncbi:MAG: NADPH-dependent 7-cyano-7-deazaguanine reductase QueF [Gammaproteobacteria bacterium]|nr:NADPH-dependent 7-cyano-7-deazaguanine reductase QueF [Gammaproteobacteria bacterium]